MTVIEEALALGMNQREIADATNVSLSMVCRWVGKCRPITPERERLLLARIRKNKEKDFATN